MGKRVWVALSDLILVFLFDRLVFGNKKKYFVIAIIVILK